jgi:hypothetical protein
MKTFVASAALSNGKYSVTFPAKVTASGYPAACTRAVAKVIKMWKANGHRRLPLSIELSIRPLCQAPDPLVDPEN